MSSMTPAGRPLFGITLEQAYLRVMLGKGDAGAGDQGFHDLDARVRLQPTHRPQQCGQLARLQLIHQLPYSCL